VVCNAERDRAAGGADKIDAVRIIDGHVMCADTPNEYCAQLLRL
jgi:hypothetical protein